MRYFGAPRGHVRQIRSRPDPLTRDKSAPESRARDPLNPHTGRSFSTEAFCGKPRRPRFGPESAWDSWNIRKQVNRLGAFNSPKYAFQLCLFDLRPTHAIFQSSSLPEIPAKSACAVVLSGPDARRSGPQRPNTGTPASGWNTKPTAR